MATYRVNALLSWPSILRFLLHNCIEILHGLLVTFQPHVNAQIPILSLFDELFKALLVHHSLTKQRLANNDSTDILLLDLWG